jgi:hypothetical protein
MTAVNPRPDYGQKGTRERSDAATAADPDSRLIARLTGIWGETVSVEIWGDLYPEDTPILIVHGPRGAERYRFSARQGDIAAFARELLRWATPEGPDPEWRILARERAELCRHLHEHPDHAGRYAKGHDFVLTGTDQIRKEHLRLHTYPQNHAVADYAITANETS